MIPALRPGDRLLVDTRAYRDRVPVTGEIVVFVDPEAASRWLIKRVGGVGPGRFWRTRAGVRAIAEESTAPGAAPPIDAVEAMSLPAASIWVTADAPTGRDSRQFGPVPVGQVVGRAYRCYAPPHRRHDL
jgi:Signal peptidase, peptidase S26